MSELEPVPIDIDNRETKRKLALFRAMLAMRGAKIVCIEHGHVTVECLKGDEQGVRELADKFGIMLGAS